MVRKASTRRSGTGTKSVMDLYMQTVTLALPVPMDDSPKIPPKTEHNDSNTNTQWVKNKSCLLPVSWCTSGLCVFPWKWFHVKCT